MHTRPFTTDSMSLFCRAASQPLFAHFLAPLISHAASARPRRVAAVVAALLVTAFALTVRLRRRPERDQGAVRHGPLRQRTRPSLRARDRRPRHGRGRPSQAGHGPQATRPAARPAPAASRAASRRRCTAVHVTGLAAGDVLRVLVVRAGDASSATGDVVTAPRARREHAADVPRLRRRSHRRRRARERRAGHEGRPVRLPRQHRRHGPGRRQRAELADLLRHREAAAPRARALHGDRQPRALRRRGGRELRALLRVPRGDAAPSEPYGTVRFGNARFFFLNGMRRPGHQATSANGWSASSRAPTARPGLAVALRRTASWPVVGGPARHRTRGSSRPGCRELLAAHKVDLLFAGHDHIYERGDGRGPQVRRLGRRAARPSTGTCTPPDDAQGRSRRTISSQVTTHGDALQIVAHARRRLGARPMRLHPGRPVGLRRPGAGQPRRGGTVGAGSDLRRPGHADGARHGSLRPRRAAQRRRRGERIAGLGLAVLGSPQLSRAFVASRGLAAGR